MDAMVRRKIEMAARVAEFSRSNPADDPSYEMLVAKLESLLAQGAVLAERERVGRLASRSAARRRLALMRALEVKLMPHVIRVARVAEKESPEVGGKFAFPRDTRATQTFLTAVAGMVATAEASRELLVRHGLSAQVLEAVAKAVEELRSNIGAMTVARREHIEARAAFRVLAAEMMQVVGVLDGLNRFRFLSDPARMGAWSSAKNVVGPFVRGGGSAKPPEGEAERTAA